MRSRQASSESEIRLPGKFRECLCAHEQASANDYARLVWQRGATFQTRLIAPFVRRISHDFFQAEDDCVGAIADCRRRSDVRDEVLLLRSGIRRRGWLRLFGVGLSVRRVMRLFDELAQVDGAWSELSSRPQSPGREGITYESYTD